MLALGGRSDFVRLRRVRLHGAADRLLARQRFEAALSVVTSSTIGLPPQALLVVRRVAPAEPLRFGSAGSAARFGKAVRTDLEGIARRARRQWVDPDAAAAGAVLFADEAELVACLVRDWLRGRIADRWWWRSVLGDLSPREWLRLHVLARGEVLVPAIAVLATGPDAAAWLARLEDAEAEEALAVIARTHALSQAIARIHAMSPTVARDDSAEQRPRARNDRHGLSGIESDRRAGSRSTALERLIAAVPEARTPTLRRPQRRLLAVALALTRAPSWARTPQLAFALRELDRSVPGVDARAHATSDAVPEEISETLAPRVAPVTGATPVTGDMPMQRAASPTAADGAGASPLQPAEPAALAQRGAEVASFGIPDAARDLRPAVPRTVVGEVPATQPEIAPAAPIPKTNPPPAPSFENTPRIRTRFGGIFYLLNAALAMQLYSDFTAPRGANLKCSPWDWLALIGREWFGKEFVRDPVWKLLAGLAGRERRLRRPRWLKGQLESLLVRLALALGEDPAGLPVRVCCYPAEVAATVTRVDVHLALSDLPLAIRIAGLDRDPGWIPATGGSIAFHFE